MNRDELIQVAKIGRLVGLRGELKLNIHCDFPEQFSSNNTFFTDKNFNLEVESFNEKKNTILFRGFQSRESAAKLVNVNLFTTKDESLKNCKLETGEFFWFEMIGSSVVDDDKEIGVVDDIQRIAQSDYLIIKTSYGLVKEGLPKLFYLPYVDRYIVDFNKDNRVVTTKDAYGILENS